MTHHCPGSRVIAEQVIAQCDDDADIASSVLLFAAAIAGLKAGRHVGEMMQDLLIRAECAEVLTGVKQRSCQ